MKLHPTTVTDAHFLTLKDFYTDIQQISLVQLAKSNPPSFEHPIFFPGAVPSEIPGENHIKVTESGWRGG